MMAAKISALHLSGALNFSLKVCISKGVVLDPQSIINALLAEIGDGGISNINAVLVVSVKSSDYPIMGGE